VWLAKANARWTIIAQTMASTVILLDVLITGAHGFSSLPVIILPHDLVLRVWMFSGLLAGQSASPIWDRGPPRVLLS
jgi:hypothetical protein